MAASRALQHGLKCSVEMTRSGQYSIQSADYSCSIIHCVQLCSVVSQQMRIVCKTTKSERKVGAHTVYCHGSLFDTSPLPPTDLQERLQHTRTTEPPIRLSSCLEMWTFNDIEACKWEDGGCVFLRHHLDLAPKVTC